DVGHRADVGVLRSVPRDEQHLALLPHVDGEGDGHSREDDGVFEGDQPECRHGPEVRTTLEVVNHWPYQVSVPDMPRSSRACEGWELLFDLRMRQRTRLPQVAAEFELSEPQCHVLRLMEPGAGVPMRRVVERLGCDASNVTGIVDRLEARGLVERTA